MCSLLRTEFINHIWRTFTALVRVVRNFLFKKLVWSASFPELEASP